MKKFIIFLLIILIVIFIIIFNKKEKNIFINNKYYIKENDSRYKDYYLKHKSFNINKIVLHVNMGIDKPFYTNIKTINYNGKKTLVNKYYKLEDNYFLRNPYKINNKYTTKDIYVNKLIIDDLYKMLSDLEKENMHILIVSGYRTKEYQEKLYNNYLKKDGIKKADTYSARKRHSEHELGLSIDVKSLNTSMEEFDKSKEFIWFKNHSYKYGFILRYPTLKEYLTGYKYEPWHYRYVGKDISKYIKKHNITFDEYYELFLR